MRGPASAPATSPPPGFSSRARRSSAWRSTLPCGRRGSSGSALVPLAWAGGASELLSQRVQDRANLFVANAALGLRLVAVEPIVESATSARRLGTVAAEARLSVPYASRQDETFVVETDDGPVMLRRSFGDCAPAGNGFVIAGPNGAPLLEATIAADAAASARARWQSGVDRLALTALALTLVVAAAIVVLERQARRQPRARAAATARAIALVWVAWLVATSAVIRGAAAMPSIGLDAGRGRDLPADFAATGLALLVSVMLLVDPVRRATPRGGASATPTAMASATSSSGSRCRCWPASSSSGCMSSSSPSCRKPSGAARPACCA